MLAVAELQLVSLKLHPDLYQRFKESLPPLPPTTSTGKERKRQDGRRHGGGKQGGLSLLVRQFLHLYFAEQMPLADQWHLVDIDEEDPLRRMEARVYALEAAAYDEGRDLTAEESKELQQLEADLLELAHELAAGRQPSFEQTLAVSLVGRCYVLAHHEFKQAEG